MTNTISKILHRAKLTIFLGLSVTFIAVVLVVVAFNNFSESLTFSSLNQSLAVVTIVSISGLWLIISRVFHHVEKELLQNAQQTHKANVDLQQRVEAHTTELEMASKELQKSLQAKSEFLATMSHEIRTPMNGVLGMAQLLVETDLSERQRRYVSIINVSGKSLLEVLNNVLDFSKIEAGKMELENIPFDLQSMVDECLGVFSLKAQERKVNLYGGLSHDTPRVLYGDPTRLRQVLVNLVSNAVKFTFNGDVSLEVIVSKEQPRVMNKVKLQFVVKDEGIGIDEEQQQKLFKAFSQSNTSTTRKFGGTGLGLVISRQLLRLMGGDIGVISKQGEGSTFYVELELSVLAEKECPTYRVVERSLKGISALVVDSPNAAKLYSAQLRHWGATVYSTSSRSEAVKLIGSLKEDEVLQILTATTISDGSGMELIEDLQSHFPARKFQVILVAPIITDRIDTPPPGIYKIIERPVSSSVLHKAVIEASVAQSSNSLTPIVLPIRYDFGDVRALVAEDNQINQMVINGILKKFKITPTIVENGADAVSIVESEKNDFDLILMDCEMPVMDGWEAAEMIRKREILEKTSSPVKIVALSAHVIADPKRKAMESGMDRFVSKPINIDSVGEILHEYFPRDAESIMQERVTVN